MIRGAVPGQKCRALRVVEHSGKRHKLVGRDHDLLGVAAEPCLHDHPVADVDAIDTRDLDHLARRFDTRQ